MITFGRLLMQTKRKCLCFAVLVPVFTIAGVSAQESVLDDREGALSVNNESHWGIGVAAISNQQSIKGIDRDTRFIPIVTYENEYIRWFGPFIDIKLPGLELGGNQALNFSVSGGFDFSGYDEDEANETPILRGMDEREGAFAVGPKVEWSNSWGNVSAQWMTDVSGDREGNSASLSVEKNWMFLQKVMVTPYVGINWLDDSFVDFHYGVRPEEVTSYRPAYTGSSTINIEYGVRAAYIFDKNNSLMADFRITSLGSEIKDSPLVDSSTENNLLLFYMYKF